MAAKEAEERGDRLVVVADFNETLVRERTLPAWCRTRMQTGTAGHRLAAAARCLPRGAAAMLIDGLGLDVLAARIGFGALRGVAPAELEAWAERGLTPHPGAARALRELAAEARELELLVVSRGSPELVVRAHLASEAARSWLAELPLAGLPDVLAPELEIADGLLTGRVTGSLEAKAGRTRLVTSHNAVFMGDRRDLQWVHRLGTKRPRFVQIS